MTLTAASGARADGPLHGASAGEAYRRFWQRYVVFTGRAGRAEYWWPALINTVVVAALAVLLVLVLVAGESLRGVGSPASAVTNALSAVLVLILVLFTIAQVVPSIALSVRRLHDVDLSGLLVLVALIPSVGGLILLVLHVLPGAPRGQRYDRGGRPVAAPAGAPIGAPQRRAAAFDSWPSDAGSQPVTAPVPVEVRADLDPPLAPDGALQRAWAAVGAVSPLAPPMSAPASWRRHGYLRVATREGAELLATDGLSTGEGAAALGPGAELFLVGAPDGTDPAEGWRFGALAAVANRIAISGMHLPSELEQYGTLSMTVPAGEAPESWRTPQGGLGVLVGLPSALVPAAVATAGGEVRLASVVPLTPAELQLILAGGADARGRIAARLAALPPRELLARA